MAELRVFLADDHAVVREGLKALVNGAAGMVVCGEAADGLSACEQVERLLPDVAVMDVSMPGLGGAEATARLKRSCPQVKVLALTVHEDRGYLHRLLEAGACGYALKRAAPGELIHAIRTVAIHNVREDLTPLWEGPAARTRRPESRTGDGRHFHPTRHRRTRTG
jgi:DNA-binding NarL/FixJ family response regulator